MDILRGVESKALALRDTPPVGTFMHIDDTAADIALPMERPLHTPPLKPAIIDAAIDTDEVEVDAGALFSQIVIDKAVLSRHIRHALQQRSRITLRELCQERPLEQGLAELIAYLQLAGEEFKAAVDEENEDIIAWRDSSDRMKQARLPRVIFVR
jgi:hypothetical protein